MMMGGPPGVFLPWSRYRRGSPRMTNPDDATIDRLDPDSLPAQEMATPADSAAELVGILDRYMAELRSGRAPDRDRLLADHPELAAQLEACLAGIEFVHLAA